MKKISVLFMFTILFCLNLCAQESEGSSNIGPLLPPEITLISPSTNPCVLVFSSVNISINFKNVRSEKDIKFTYLKDKKAIKSNLQREASGGVEVAKSNLNSGNFDLSWDVNLSEGMNEFEVIATNEIGQTPLKISFEYQKITLPKLWAVVVGVSKYQQSEISLKYAADDAEAYYNFLKSPNGGGVTSETSVLLVNQNATRENILREVNEKCNKAAKQDIIIIYMACHGMPDPNGEEVYFLSYDTKKNSLVGTGVSQFDIDKSLKKARAEKKVWIIDACHSGGASISMRGDFAYLTNKLMLEASTKSQGYAILTASSKSEFSREGEQWGGGHGAFTYHLLKGLEGSAEKNGDGFIDIRELSDYVIQNVVHDTNGEQHPEYKYDNENRIPLAILNDKK